MSTPVKWYKTVVGCVVALVLCVALGVAGMMAAYSLPTEPMREHVEQSVEYFKGVPQPHETPDRAVWQDRFTDALMLLEPLYQETIDAPLLERALLVYQPAGTEDSATKLLNFLDGQRGEHISYGRYWHGYATVLNPLLEVLTYAQIRMVNLGILAVLALAVVVLLVRKRLSWLVLPFVATLICLTPLTVARTLCYMASLSLALVGIALVLAWGRSWARSWCAPVAFCLGGIAVNYFDYLDFPLVSLGLPLVALVALNRDRRWANIGLGVACAVAWCFGYFGMWGAKWLVGTLLTGYDLIADATMQVTNRTNTVSIGFDGSVAQGYKDVLYSIVILYLKPAGYALAGGYLVATLVQEVVVHMMLRKRGQAARMDDGAAGANGVAGSDGTAASMPTVTGAAGSDGPAGNGSAVHVADAANAADAALASGTTGQAAPVPRTSGRGRHARPASSAVGRGQLAPLLVCYAAIALLPFIWIAATQNHTFMHHFFTYRILAVSIFAATAALATVLARIRPRVAPAA